MTRQYYYPTSIIAFIAFAAFVVLSSSSSSSSSSYTANAFLSPSLSNSNRRSSSSSSGSPSPSSQSRSTTFLNEGRIEQIEFKIYPDGRIEESVRGIKGGECHKVTEEINQSLGKVVDSKPTEEMYEQEIVIDQTIEIQNGNNGGGSGGGWDGASSW
eukprot:CAMPEP_0203634448 /NCGR_PEP_ID=MMETSP0088-20131115/1397_1 /ASSEMBLY_ACC=CAM_ASM_001087 /TAXON_ID=426623 /ORGANISM="Chaetoceros affinis, Strain CCMP159" /LENGTH=156 /DNA_ID=CAMNT_0050488061 /DNA_START=120 /DNA_END=587 /DNA_ORIENTATION=+